MKRSIQYILIIAGFIPTYLFGQTSTEYNSCYEDTISSEGPVFTKIEINAYFNGDRGLQAFLLKNINHNKLVKELSRNKPVFADTASILFIISKFRKMSNLQVRKTKNLLFLKEIEQIIKLSSCFWEPGEYSGRRVNGWYKYDIFYFAELKASESTIRISIKSYDFVDELQEGLKR